MPDVDLAVVESGFLASGVPQDLVTELLETFVEAKRRFHLGDFRPNAVEGGRFSEATLRILQWMTSAKYTPLSDPKFKADTVMTALPNLPTGSAPESVRLHLPRAVRVIYDIRNKRNTAHLSDGIDPNLQDATLVVATMDWILAELVRLHHNVSASIAQTIIEGLVSREVPMVQVFDGVPRILASLTRADHVLVLLYWYGDKPITRKELNGWLPPNLKKHIASVLKGLHEKHLVNLTTDSVHITRVGFREVEQRRLIQPV